MSTVFDWHSIIGMYIYIIVYLICERIDNGKKQKYNFASELPGEGKSIIISRVCYFDQPERVRRGTPVKYRRSKYDKKRKRYFFQ